jgi:hypothetical protein
MITSREPNKSWPDERNARLPKPKLVDGGYDGRLLFQPQAYFYVRRRDDQVNDLRPTRDRGEKRSEDQIGMPSRDMRKPKALNSRKLLGIPFIG